jgi:hypothetical protein
MLEVWRKTDAHEGDSEKTYVIAELLSELTCFEPGNAGNP